MVRNEGRQTQKNVKFDESANMKTLINMVGLIAKKDRVISMLWSEVDSRLAKLPQAARGYIKDIAYNYALSNEITVPEHKRLIAWCEKAKPCFKASDKTGQNSYYVYPDGSLFLSCTAEDEVWDSASDRADEIAQFTLVPLDSMDEQLFEHLGRPVYRVRRDKGDGFRHIESAWANDKAAEARARECKTESKSECDWVVTAGETEVCRL